MHAVFLESAASALREPLSAVHIFRKHPKSGVLYLNWTVSALVDNDVLMIQNHDEFFEAANWGANQAFETGPDKAESAAAEEEEADLAIEVATFRRKLWLLFSDPYSSR